MFLGATPLDRSANQRREDGWVDERLAADNSRYLPFWRMNPRPRRRGLLWLDRGVRRYLESGAEPLLLGLKEGVAHFATDVSALEDPLAALGLQDAEFADARGVALDLPEGEAGILSQARSLLEWHRRHRFCAGRGAPHRCPVQVAECAGAVPAKRNIFRTRTQW